ncbi:ABC transporter substrate-binding protein [Roseibium polysiphoniae]|uniref:ABC transporter substrate-binding protein n=1 Tax=Roseibium polysiphoniae TaxID=2571221 RepID=A0A944C594_9HYPH|nr:ABC transporter substrate-binding protein [Roseibium polysiphoniae]MBD8874711.1 ABC transporter substrate-binding protein [Roseibium polysiphoniae]MBS8258596.1 ABC transporter substrate-binding protein [Roseibium polysiphoniae]
MALRNLRGAALAALSIAALATVSFDAWAAGTLRVGMTASDIPLTTGQTDQGGEGMRFMGYTVYDSLIEWDLTSADKASVLIPGLATEWTVDPDDNTKWTFKIREGVTFHDGSPFTAHDVVWNFDKLLVPESEQYDPRQSAQGKSRIPAVASYKALDDFTLEIITKTPDATLPYQLAWILMSSKANWEALDKNWEEVAKAPSGTGPWKLTGFVPRERAELVPNEAYWDASRVPQLDKMVLMPLPEPNARTAALLSGQVDWIEAPAPDTIPALTGNGMEIVSNAYPHNWTWHLSRLEGSPWNDIRVRKAANLAIDRDGLKALLGGLAIPAKGFLPPASQWFGEPTFEVKYDPEAAKALLAEAGFGPENPIKAKALISPSGSGQMLPLPMNEYVQQSLAEVGIEVEFMVVEWNQMINLWRAGAADPSVDGSQSINFTYFIQDPFTGLIRHLSCDLIAPNGTNWGHYCDPEMQALFDEIKTTFDPEAQNAVLRKTHEKYVNDALFLMVTHDVAPRAMSPKVKGFIQAQNWYQNFSGITIEE